MEKNHSASGVAWLALVISVIALIIAWNAFNRAGKDLEAMVADQVEEATAEMRQELNEAEREARQESAEALDEAAQETQEAANDVRTETPAE